MDVIISQVLHLAFVVMAVVFPLFAMVGPFFRLLVFLKGAFFNNSNGNRSVRARVMFSCPVYSSCDLERT